MTDGLVYPERPERWPLMADAEMFGDGRRLGEIRIRNISAEGLGGSGFDLRIGQPIAIRLNGIGLVPGRVIWSNGLVFGLCFDQSIDVSAFDVTGDLRGAENFAAGVAVHGSFHAT